MKSVISLIETIWHVGVLLFSLSYFGGFAALVYKLGESALTLHKKGLISLVDLNCALQGDDSLGVLVKKAHQKSSMER